LSARLARVVAFRDSLGRPARNAPVLSALIYTCPQKLN
jgi:hypothetical protein